MFVTKTVVAVTVPGDARTHGKCAASSFAEPTLHNFITVWSIPLDVCDFMAPDIGGGLLYHRHTNDDTPVQ